VAAAWTVAIYLVRPQQDQFPCSNKANGVTSRWRHRPSLMDFFYSVHETVDNTSHMSF